jgi:hypothetical protein
MTEPSKETVELPEGVKRWRSGTEVVESSTPTPRKMEVTRMFESEDGEWIDIYDLPIIEAQTLDRVREALLSERAVTAGIGAYNEADAAGLVASMQGRSEGVLNPWWAFLEAALSTLDSVVKGGEERG